MLPHVPGFDVRPTAYGYLLAAPDRTGYIRFERRVLPLVRVSELVRPRIATLVVRERGPIVSTVTEEGEYGARTTVIGTENGAWVRRDVGIVFGDDFAVIATGTCLVEPAAPRIAGAIDTIVAKLALGAPARRRRYRYAAPPGRRARVRGLETDWVADDTLTVFPAERGGLALARTIAEREGFAAQVAEGGTLVTAHAEGRWRMVAARAIGGWVYCMELAAHGERDPAPLRACIASIEPLPTPRAKPVVPVIEVD